MNSIDFLMNVWGIHCRPGDYVCVSSKKDRWSDRSFAYDNDLRKNLRDWMDKRPDHDLYFSPLPYKQPGRNKEHVARSRLLWSDIDEAPTSTVKPSILWESSPGRHQGLWLMPKQMEPDRAAELSRQLAYYIGADRGGWDLTQVLRIPGTINNKYANRPTVKLCHFNKDVLHEVPQRAIDKWSKTIPRSLFRLIEGPAQVGHRSDMLWRLEHELCDLGIPLPDVIEILRNSDWNKYRGRRDEDERFAAEMEKIRGDRDTKRVRTRTDDVTLRVVDYSELMGSSAGTPGWMIRDYWMKGSNGIIAGEPKSFKSTLSMDMLFAVASDTKFLGEYDVEYGGPVLIVQNENADWIMKDRLEKLAYNRGEVGNIRTANGRKLRVEWARNLPMFFVNQQGFTLDDAANLAALEELIQRIKPVAIKLDPLYLMFAGDVNSAKELNPVLNWCLGIKQEYGCSVLLVHHYNKGTGGQRGGQRMLGSTTLHGWVESAWYIQAQEPEGNTARVTLDREFRGAGIYQRQALHIDVGSFGDMQYDVRICDEAEEKVSTPGEIISIMEQSTDSMSKADLSKKLGLPRKVIDKAVDELFKEGKLKRKGERYELD